MKTVRLNSKVKALVTEKIEGGMCKRFYLESLGHVSNLLNCFAVPKGVADIQVVFDGTLCGLNTTVWAPTFVLPTATFAAMLLSFGTWMADMDFGEVPQFPDERKDAQVRLSGFRVPSQGRRRQGYYQASEMDEVVYGDATKPFQRRSLLLLGRGVCERQSVYGVQSDGV
jgi:hypothetical protein